MKNTIENVNELSQALKIQVANTKSIIDMTNATTINTTAIESDMLNSLSAAACTINNILITAAFTAENKSAKVISSDTVEYVENSLNHTLNLNQLDSEYDEEEENDSDNDKD